MTDTVECPRCGGLMRVVKPRPGGKSQFDPFMGCKSYPECRGTRNIDQNTGEIFYSDEEMDRRLITRIMSEE